MLLQVRDLSVEFRTVGGTVRAVNGVSFSLAAGTSLGLVGESGCGKSTTGYALMRLLPPNGQITGGEVILEGIDLLSLSEAALRKVRWEKIALVFQNAMSALNPVLRVGDQIINALRQHRQVSRAEALAKAEASFERVGLSPSRLMHYPHEFSGGMKQRAVMAMALICDPLVLIADEPTTALDVVAQRQVLELLGDLRDDLGLSLILISHDISAVAEICTEVAVMYAGEIMEYGPSREVFHHYRHPYTWALVNSFPSLYTPLRTLVSLPGAPPNLMSPPVGCPFAPRCRFKQDICTRERPPLVTLGARHTSRCHFALELDFDSSNRANENVAG